MPRHPHTKLILVLCFFGLLAFLATAVGLASDYWLVYELSSEPAGDQNSTDVRLDRVGVWKVCYRTDTPLPADGNVCHSISYTSNMETDNPLYQYTYHVNGKNVLLAFLVLLVIGVALVFAAEVLAMICIKKQSKTLYIGTSIAFITAGLVTSAGLIVFTVQSSNLLADWPDQVLGESPYEIIRFGWSFAITWLGAALSFLNSCGYIWLARRHTDAMM